MAKGPKTHMDQRLRAWDTASNNTYSSIANAKSKGPGKVSKPKKRTSSKVRRDKR